MKYTSDAKQVQEFLQQRLLLEQNLAHALMDEFDRGKFNEEVQQAVLRMLIFLVGLEGAAAHVVTTQERAQSFLLGLSANGGTVLGALDKLISNGKLPLVHCADLIRFYGEIIDDASKDGTLLWFRQERAKQISWRYGGGGQGYKGLRTTDKATGLQARSEADKGTVWQKVASAGFGQGGRIRMKPPQSPVNPFAGGGVNPFYDIVPGRSFDDPIFKAFGVRADTSAGSVGWVLQNKSTVKRVDLAFGLPFGADISGTTTDCMHFMSGYTDLRGKDPLLFMLPLATIVSTYHHALLEVALAMSLKKVIDYKISFYSTLLPALPPGATPHPQRNRVKEILEAFDNRGDSRHILVHYINNTNKIGGAFTMEPADYDKFKLLATCDIRQWPRFNSMKNDFPSENDIMTILGEVGLTDAALQSRRGALRPVGPRPSDSRLPGQR